MVTKNDSIAQEFSKIERAEISRKFREEIKQHGLANAILGLVASKSPKAAVRKTVLVYQCRKADFATQFAQECDNLKKSNPSLGFEIISLKNEIISRAK